MKFFVLPSLTQNMTLLAAALIILTSCTSQRHVPTDIPLKVFQYSYQEPSRQIISSALSKKLSSGKPGDMIYMKYDNKSSTIRLGKNYDSANGYTCRHYIVSPSNEKTACKINNRWYQAKPILIKK